MRRVLTAFVVCAAMVTSACTSTNGEQSPTAAPSTADGSVSPTGAITPEFDPAKLPPVPAPTLLTGIDPTARAADLVAATADELDDVTPGWLAAYAEFGVPVIDTRDPADPVDPVGPTWDQVWSVGQISRGEATMSWPGVTRVLTFDNGRDGVLLDPQVGIDDLRAAAAGDDPLAQTLARFIAAKSVSSGFADPLDPATTVGAVSLDAATVQLMTWVVLRGALVTSTAAEAAAAAADPSITSSVAQGAVAEFDLAGNLSRARGGQKPCSQVFGTSDLKSWILWLSNKVNGGLSADKAAEVYGYKVAFRGAIETLLQKVASLSSRLAPATKFVEKVTPFLNWANVAASFMSVLAQYNAMTLDVSTAGEPPLIRRKDTQPGSNQNLTLTLSYEFKALNINNPILCIIAYMANAAGIGLGVPEDGSAIAGSRVIASEDKNMPDRIEFVGANTDHQVLLYTDEAGKGTVQVRGHARAKALPGSAKEKQDTFGVSFSAQFEESNKQSGLNVVVDTAGVAIGIGTAPILPVGVIIAIPSALSLAVDLIKLAQHDVGSRILPFTDWESGGWRVDQPSDTGSRYTAVICDLDAPFTVFDNEPAVFGYTFIFDQGETYDFTPTGNGGYTIAEKNYFWDEQGRVSEAARVEGVYPASLVYDTPGNEPAAIFIPSIVPGLLPDMTFTLIPDPSACDLPPDTRVRAGTG